MRHQLYFQSISINSSDAARRSCERLHENVFYCERALLAGARGYLSKSQGMEHLIQAIHQILAGGRYLSEDLEAALGEKCINGRVRAENLSPEKLSDRELQVFEMIGTGVTTGEIAQTLQLSLKTVDSHREHIKEKLGLSTAAELVKQAFLWVHHHSWNRPDLGETPPSSDGSSSDQSGGI